MVPLERRQSRGGRRMGQAGLACVGLAALLGASGVQGCLARSDEPYAPLQDDAGAPTLVDGSTDPEDAPTNLPPSDPHAVLGVEPPQGPFSGGRTVLVRGAGFGTDVRVWFGDAEVPREAVTPVDASRVQVVTPPSDAGLVAVTAQNGDDESTRRTLAQAYEYERFEVTPASGPTSGGTPVTLRGAGTAWTAATTVEVGDAPCASLTRVSATELTCVTPPATPGARPVRVTTGDEVLTVLDAFTYGDTSDGYRGGLSGAPLEDELSVIVLDNYTGRFIVGATAVLDDDLTTASRSDASGVARFATADLGPARTVTVAKDCYQPTTFVGVRVDTVTVYLDPVLSPACGELGELPATGGAGDGGAAQPHIAGELVWPSSVEFKREGFTNVPPPTYAGETRAAYVFRTSSSATSHFVLPSAGEAVTADSPGAIGYAFELSASPGTYTLYALAGIENRDRNPPTFTAYAMGLVQGVTARSGGAASELYLPIDIPLDHAISLDVTGPTPTQRGPDRLIATAAVRVAEREHVILPIGSRELALPATDPLRFVGLPPLGGALLGAQYVVSARAVTGPSAGDPSSTVGLFASTTDALSITGFVEVPRLVTPEVGAAWDGHHLAVTWPAGGAPVSLTLVEVESGGGLVTWTIVLPEGVTEAVLPDLDALGSSFGLVRGPITFVLSAASIAGFDYGALRYRDLGSGGWDAYARDAFHARF